MPWKECSVMDERLRFVARLLDGEAMSAVCRAFGRNLSRPFSAPAACSFPRRGRLRRGRDRGFESTSLLQGVHCET
jgi:hypothetical protein